MKHATVKLGDWVVPLIGVPRTATQETCDRCRRDFHMTQITLNGNGKLLCPTCLKVWGR